MTYAQTQAGWRLPNVKELASITDKTRINPAIDPVAFPATPSSWFWTSTPYAGDASYAWYVGFSYGVVLYVYRVSGYKVRLVR